MRNRLGFAAAAVAGGVAIGIAVGALAGQMKARRDAEPGFHQRCELMNAALGLDGKQEARVHQILEKSRGEMEKSRKSCGDRAKALHEETDREIRSILTDDQRKKFDGMREKRRAHAGRRGDGWMGRRHGGGGAACGQSAGGMGKGKSCTPWGDAGAGRMADRHIGRLAKELGLTGEQVSKVKAVFEGKRSRMEKIRVECGPCCRKLRESADKDIRAVLTAEQAKIFDRIQAAREKSEKTGCAKCPGCGPSPKGHGPKDPPPKE